ncbi:centromere protein S-like [Apostichopus japonicus]|uniref:centromere protein S-like n=1 Tax=Stichopus japonicus TaxID=307972 RepID=UPI003AB8D1F1
MGDESDEGASVDLEVEQRLKAAVHYTVGKICNNLEEELEITFSKHVIAVISEATFKQTDCFAKDLENFCQHAKRKAINADDVKLLARRSGSLAKHISKVHKRLKENDETQKKKKSNKKAKTSHRPVE